MAKTISNRYEFVLLFDVENGNPNGDPDMGNMPRVDPETGNGIITDVCIKRKIRNYVELTKAGESGYEIYVTEGAVLNDKQKKIYEDNGLTPSKNSAVKDAAKEFMCAAFYDIRTFGAVMDTGDHKCGQVRGPVQLCFGRSIDPILQQEVTITRMAVTNEKDVEKERTMGRKYVVPYALYRMEGYISPAFAAQTGFTEDDLELLLQALWNMFEHDHSAARGKMCTRELLLFKHDSPLGNAHANRLFDAVTVSRNDAEASPRRYDDYSVSIDEAAIPAGVTLIRM